MHRRLLFAALAAALLAAAAPPPDQTAPRLRWEVRSPALAQPRFFDGNGAINLRHGAVAHITISAINWRGVHEITLGAHATWTCRKGSVGQQRDAAGQKQVQTVQPDSSGHMSTRLSLLRDSTAMPCESGYHFENGREVFAGTGENYSHKTRNGTLTVNFTP